MLLKYSKCAFHFYIFAVAFKFIFMKTTLLIALVFVFGLSSFSQKYKSYADTVKLNQEHVSISNDIAELTAKLTICKNNLPDLKKKALDAHADTKAAAEANSRQALKATNGYFEEIKEAYAKAKEALRLANKAKDADGNVQDMEEKIVSLTEKINLRDKRLRELEMIRNGMRIALNDSTKTSN